MKPDDARRERLLQVVGRPLLLAFWSLVLWGGLYDFVLIRAAFVEGPRVVLHRVLSGGDIVAGFANLVLAALAPIVWGLVGIAIRQGRTSAAARRRASKRGERGGGGRDRTRA